MPEFVYPFDVKGQLGCFKVLVIIFYEHFKLSTAESIMNRTSLNIQIFITVWIEVLIFLG